MNEPEETTMVDAATFTTDHFMRLLDPTAWAREILEQAKTSAPASPQATEAALFITGQFKMPEEPEEDPQDF